jgi:hypothetical protein
MMMADKIRLTLGEINTALSLLAHLTDKEIADLELDAQTQAVALKLRSAMENSQPVILPGRLAYG